MYLLYLIISLSINLFRYIVAIIHPKLKIYYLLFSIEILIKFYKPFIKENFFAHDIET